FAIRLNSERPSRLIIKDQPDRSGFASGGPSLCCDRRDALFGIISRRDGPYFLNRCADFIGSDIRTAVRPINSVMHLCLDEWGLAPAEVADNFRSVRKGLMRPKPYHPRIGRWIVRRPVNWSRLLFHDPPTSPATGPIEIVMESWKIGISGPKEF